MKTILVGTDTSAAADLAVEDAAGWPATGAPSCWCSTWSRTASSGRSSTRRRPPTRGYLAQMPERFPGVTTCARVESGDAAERIVAVAAEHEADTIVVGNRGVHGTGGA